MNILSIDTTTKSAAVAIAKNDMMTEKNIANEITHSEKLLPLIDECLKESSLTLDNIDLFSCMNGPGSFTGIRIGLSTIKAFAQVKEKPIFTMDSLKAMAYATYLTTGIQEKKYIVSLIDARNNRVYFAMYCIEHIKDKIAIQEIISIANDDIHLALTQIVNQINQSHIVLSDILITSNCTELYQEQISSLINTKVVNCYPTPSDLIHASKTLINAKDYFQNAYTLDAIYARPSQAERMKNEKNEYCCNDNK